MRNFDEWLSKFRTSISSYDYYIDFEKVVVSDFMSCHQTAHIS